MPLRKATQLIHPAERSQASTGAASPFLAFPPWRWRGDRDDGRRCEQRRARAPRARASAPPLGSSAAREHLLPRRYRRQSLRPGRRHPGSARGPDGPSSWCATPREDPARAAERQEHALPQAGETLAREYRQTILPTGPELLRGRSNPEPRARLTRPSRTAGGFILVPATPEARALSGQTVEVSRGAQGRSVGPHDPLFERGRGVNLVANTRRLERQLVRARAHRQASLPRRSRSGRDRTGCPLRLPPGRRSRAGPCAEEAYRPLHAVNPGREAHQGPRRRPRRLLVLVRRSTLATGRGQCRRKECPCTKLMRSPQEGALLLQFWGTRSRRDRRGYWGGYRWPVKYSTASTRRISAAGDQLA
jgi:hypothetical protein